MRCLLFLFASRRRHTRWPRDWSSDVCSSDLEVLPPQLGKVLPGRRSPWAAIVFTTLLAFGLIWGVTQVAGENTVAALGGTTALLLLAVFTVVNIAVIVLRRRDRKSTRLNSSH